MELHVLLDVANLAAPKTEGLSQGCGGLSGVALDSTLGVDKLGNNLAANPTPPMGDLHIANRK